MSGVRKIEIQEEAAELFRLIKAQKQLKQRSRVQALYLLKDGEATSITQTDCILGYDRSTVQHWLQSYQQSEFDGLLNMAHGGGKPRFRPGRKRSSRLAWSSRGALLATRNRHLAGF